MVAVRVNWTLPVLATNVPEAAPPFILIDPGTANALLSSDKTISAPDGGAGPDRVTLQVAELFDAKPSGEQATELRVGCVPPSPPPGDGTNLTVTLAEEPPSVAVIVRVQAPLSAFGLDEIAPVVAVKAAEVDSAETVTEAGVV